MRAKMYQLIVFLVISGINGDPKPVINPQPITNLYETEAECLAGYKEVLNDIKQVNSEGETKTKVGLHECRQIKSPKDLYSAARGCWSSLADSVHPLMSVQPLSLQCCIRTGHEVCEQPSNLPDHGPLASR